jgi:phosphoadenosine phosphosulfate reductase
MPQSNVVQTAKSVSEATAKADDLNQRFLGQEPKDVLRAVINEGLMGNIALVSSFGAESAILLHMVSEIDRHFPVIFLDTGKLFGETKRFRDLLIARFELTDVRSIYPDPRLLKERDDKGALWMKDKNMCCFLRKVEPMERALKNFDGWITGRKRFQASTRESLPMFEADESRIKFNPLAGWSKESVQTYIDAYELPVHPLVADGYKSIGCMPCTDKVLEGEDERAGRWRGADKTECGIHLSAAERAAMLQGGGI